MSQSQRWPLPDEEVHVWRVPLDQPAHAVEQLAAVLNADERQRAARFHFEHLTRQFIVGRAAMRLVLAAYLGTEPAGLSFSYGPKGKPALAGPGAASGLTFNLSHARELALLAVGRGRAIGVDLEATRPLADIDAIASRYFCAAEREMLAAAHGDVRLGWFYRFWTRKEALLKATGDGLSLPLDKIDVSGIGGRAGQTVTVLDGAGVPRALRLYDQEPGAGYTGALAVEGTGRHSRTQTWRPRLSR